MMEAATWTRAGNKVGTVAVGYLEGDVTKGLVFPPHRLAGFCLGPAAGLGRVGEDPGAISIFRGQF